MGLLAFRTTFSSAARRLLERPWRLPNLGIVPRMAISFAAVALLAGTANMIARESVHIIRTVTRSPEVQIVKQPRVERPQPAASRIAVSKIAEVQRSVERFEQAVRSRVEGDTPANNANYSAAKRTLQLAILAYKQNLAEPATDWPQQVAIYLERAQELIALADQRRQARTAYGDHARAIADRIRASLDGAWTIFGRVIARKSLLQLRGELDSIRRRSEGLTSGETLDSERTALLKQAEESLAETLKTGEASLSKSEGAEWFQAVSADFSGLVRSREFLEESNVGVISGEHQFIQLGSGLENRLELAAISAESAAPKDAPSPVHLQSLSPQPQPLVSELVETTSERSDPEAARLMATVTVAVMLVIIAISVFTVRSIVLPVRKLLGATRRLAGGQANVRVGRGGIKELDIVAQAFDQMSAQLESVKDAYRRQKENLEHQVTERTYKLQQLAHQDPLTSLPNRRHLSSLLQSALSRAGKAERFVGVYFLDIDNFKNINDSLGHVFGDRVLMSVANRLEESIDGVGFVARLGGDEFTLVYEDAHSVQELNDFGSRLTGAFHRSISVDDREISVSISVGASIFPEHEADADGLLRAADSALFRAKELGRNQLAVFTPELLATAATRFRLEQGLRLALERSELELAYQPEIDLARSDVGLVEALLRWRQPDGRLARAGEFLAVAEQSGLMPEINAWVLQAALEDASRWYHGSWPEARVAINISPRQLLDRLFVEQILKLLKQYRLPAKCIELELTESVLQTGPATIAALRVLQSHGFGIALDDFGTGYSSLTSLEQLPLSRLKLDRSLVSGIDSSARASAIARAIIELCAGLGLEVTAEGIERPEQFAWFAQSTSVLLQGFLLSDAMPFTEVLPFKASLGRRLQDLLLSVHAPARPHPVALVRDAKRRTV
jgi:diguanylate cyclase (GGDEF)-like protein